jgi:two-component system response regulator QseB
MRILIVEDDSRISRAMAEDLRRQHHAVEVVEDGRAGPRFC